MTLVDLFSAAAPASTAAAAPKASEASGILFGALLALAGKTMDAGGSASLVGDGPTATGHPAAGHASESDASRTDAASPAAVLTAQAWQLADAAGIVTAQAAGGRTPAAGDEEAGAQRAIVSVSTAGAVPTSTAVGAVRADATALMDAAAAAGAPAPAGHGVGAAAAADASAGASAQPSDAHLSDGRPLGGWSVATGPAGLAAPAALAAPGGAATEAVAAPVSAASPHPAAVAAAGGAPASASPISAAGPQAAPPQAAVRPASASQESAPPTAPLPDQVGAAAAAASTPTVPAPAPAVPAASLGEAPRRELAAQISPVVVSVAQRPAGSHRITMTVHPDTFGPVTVRAHISRTGDVQVELLGATDAGRDALRAVVADLRRDLAAALPHATLNLGSGAGSGAGAGTDAGPQTGRQHDEPSDAGARGDGERHPRTATPTAVVRGIPSASSFVAGAGLDIFA